MTNVNAAVLLGFALGVAPTLGGTTEEPPHSWHFRVLLDGKPIGEHDFLLTRHADELVVDSEAHFRVAVAFVTLYTYEHHDHEVWHGGCLARLSSHTNDNGRQLVVEGVLRDQGFEVANSHGTTTLPPCVRTFAYWDRELITDPRLLNSQTGEYQSVLLTRVDDRRFVLRGTQLAIDLRYSDAGEWVALESRLESGRTLHYELH
jgi:hypothetical protein